METAFFMCFFELSAKVQKQNKILLCFAKRVYVGLFWVGSFAAPSPMHGQNKPKRPFLLRGTKFYTVWGVLPPLFFVLF